VLRAPVCPDSINAIQGALGAVCEAVDKVVSSRSNEGQPTEPTELPVHRAFVAIRPPGHHCGEDTPSGFCFVNNVAVAAAHGMAACIIRHNRLNIRQLICSMVSIAS
jgi:histone deacetylase HOS3